MANEFASTQNSAGLLKNSYEGADTLSESLKKRREALMVGKGMLDLDKQDSEAEPKA